MTLGSEFRFHGSISKRPTREASGMGGNFFLYELRQGKEWVRFGTVQASVAERIQEIMAQRGRSGAHWRLRDVDKIAPVKRAARAKKRPPVESVEEAS